MFGRGEPGGRRCELSAELRAPRRDAPRRTAVTLRAPLRATRFDEKAVTIQWLSCPCRDFCRPGLPPKISPPRPTQPLHHPHFEEEKGSDPASLPWTATGQPPAEAPLSIESSDTLCVNGRPAALRAEPRDAASSLVLPIAPGHAGPQCVLWGFLRIWGPGWILGPRPTLVGSDLKAPLPSSPDPPNHPNLPLKGLKNSCIYSATMF